MAKADILNLTNIPSPVSRKSDAPEIASYEGKLPRRMRRAYTTNGWPNLAAFNRDACAARLIQLRRAEASADLSDTTAPDDDQMALDDDEDDEDDGDYEFQERDPSGSEDDSDDEDVELGDLPMTAEKAPRDETELKEELKFLRREFAIGNNDHLDRAAIHQSAPQEVQMDVA